MSVLIKGMEMPKDGSYIFNFASDENGQNTELMIIRYASFEPIKHKGVVALPPHGRLIDADALYELLDGGYDLNFDELPETKRELLRMITDAPTVIEAEVEE